jgi:hypothetical protein
MSETLDESKRNKRTAKRILAIGLPLVLIGSVGVGYAFWTTSAGSGSGTADAAAGLTPVTLSGSITGLVPGATVNVPVMATNSNATSSVHVASIAITAGPKSNSTTTGGTNCDLVSGATATVTPAAALNVPPTPASGAGSTGTQVGVLHITMPDDATVNQDDCKGKTFTVTLASS